MSEAVENEKKIKKHPKMSKVFDILFMVFGVIALTISGLLYYQKVYLDAFYVNGQSMYPTLNEYATNPTGKQLGNNGGSAYKGCTHIDYGLMDTHKKALKKIHRFDIVVTYESEKEATKLIKRIVGLPGETIKFTSTNPNDPKNGDLYVKDGDNYVLTPQPISDEYKCNSGDKPYPTEVILGSDEYFVLGDNRAHSTDSRAYGKIKSSWLIGKVKYICGYCELDLDEEGNLYPINIEYEWPRKVK